MKRKEGFESELSLYKKLHYSLSPEKKTDKGDHVGYNDLSMDYNQDKEMMRLHFGSRKKSKTNAHSPSMDMISDKNDVTRISKLKGFIDFSKQTSRPEVPIKCNINPHETRFDNINLNPLIATSIKRTPQFSFDKTQPRDERVYQTGLHFFEYAPNFSYGKIESGRVNMNFAKMPARKPFLDKDIEIKFKHVHQINYENIEKYAARVSPNKKVVSPNFGKYPARSSVEPKQHTASSESKSTRAGTSFRASSDLKKNETFNALLLKNGYIKNAMDIPNDKKIFVNQKKGSKGEKNRGNGNDSDSSDDSFY